MGRCRLGHGYSLEFFSDEKNGRFWIPCYRKRSQVIDGLRDTWLPRRPLGWRILRTDFT